MNPETLDSITRCAAIVHPDSVAAAKLSFNATSG